MKQKIPFINRILAFLLSIIFCLVLVPSFFSLPIELVLFNPDTYHPVIEDETYQSQYPDVITKLLISHIYNPENNPQIPPILAQQTNLGFAIKQVVPHEWAVGSITDLFNHTLEYLNFKKPTPTISINTQDLKTALILNSESISADYLSSLPSCSATDNQIPLTQNNLFIFEIPPCKPNEAIFPRVNTLLGQYLQDNFNRLPAETSIVGVIPFDPPESEIYFRTYSIARWALRLLPIMTISLLIFISLLLRAQREVVFKWIGKMLIFVCGICLLGLIILLIGFDQFIALTLNHFLQQLITGLDVLILGIIHSVGYQTIVWVIVSLVITTGFGVFLILMERFLKPKGDQVAESDLSDEETEKEKEIDSSLEKTIKPETLEEIEISEKNRDRGSKGKKATD